MTEPFVTEWDRALKDAIQATILIFLRFQIAMF